jgi:hypothetical protein
MSNRQLKTSVCNASSSEITVLASIEANTDVLPPAIRTDVVEHIEFEFPSMIAEFLADAFMQYHQLKSIVIPASVKMIGTSCLFQS